MTLNGQVALVTGASRGIGRAIALGLAREGVDVAVNYRTREADALDVVKAIGALDRKAIAIRADVAVAADVTRLVSEATKALGFIGILINNAGISRPQPFESITEADWDDIVDGNLKSCFLVTHAALPAMRRERFGRIVNLSSVAAQVGGVIGPHYAASKAGMLGMTRFY